MRKVWNNANPPKNSAKITLCVSKPIFDYAMSAGMHPRIKWDHTVLILRPEFGVFPSLFIHLWFILRCCQHLWVYRVSQEKRSIFWEATVSVILSKKMYIYMCPIPNGFRDRANSVYSSKIVDKKEILRTVSNTDIYCSSDEVGTVYLV
jgi:hypothetical protein